MLPFWLQSIPFVVKIVSKVGIAKVIGVMEPERSVTSFLWLMYPTMAKSCIVDTAPHAAPPMPNRKYPPPATVARAV